MTEPRISIVVLERALFIAARLLITHGYHVDGIREPKALYQWLLREAKRSLWSQMRRELQEP